MKNTPTLEKILSQESMDTCEHMTMTIAKILSDHNVPVEEQMMVMASIMATMQAVIDDCYNEGVRAGDAGILKKMKVKAENENKKDKIEKKVEAETLPKNIDDVLTGVFKEKDKTVVRGVSIMLDKRTFLN